LLGYGHSDVYHGHQWWVVISLNPNSVIHSIFRGVGVVVYIEMPRRATCAVPEIRKSAEVVHGKQMGRSEVGQ
jgi:hypothetical protein